MSIPALETLPTSPLYHKAKVSEEYKQHEEKLSRDKGALTFHLNKSHAGHKYEITAVKKMTEKWWSTSMGTLTAKGTMQNANLKKKKFAFHFSLQLSTFIKCSNKITTIKRMKVFQVQKILWSTKYGLCKLLD